MAYQIGPVVESDDPSDIIPALLSALETRLKDWPRKEIPPKLKQTLRRARGWKPYGGEHRPRAYTKHKEMTAHIIQELIDGIGITLGDYVWFGKDYADGRGFGFWIDMDTVNDDVSAKELLKVNDLSEIPERYTGVVLVVNDHGNCTLYYTGWVAGRAPAPGHQTHEEIWSIV